MVSRIMTIPLAALLFAVPLVAWGETSFSGKTVVLTIPFNVGGGSDRWARTYSPYLSKHLPGNPTVVIRNDPGDGGVTGVNDFVKHARKDGTDVLGTSGSNQIPYVLDDKRVQYDYRVMQLVLASPVGGFAYISRDTGVNSLMDLKDFKGALRYASQGVTSLDLVPLLAFEILGLKVKPLFGYRGRGPGRVAFEQGEVNIDYQTTPAYLSGVRPMVEAGKAVTLFSWGLLNDTGEFVRDPNEPDLPNFVEAYEMLHGRKPSGPAFDAWKAFFIAGFAVQKLMWLPEGTPAEVVDTYRETARRIVKDKDFEKDSERKLGGYPQLVGESARSAFDRALHVPPESKAWLKQWLKDRFNARL